MLHDWTSEFSAIMFDNLVFNSWKEIYKSFIWFMLKGEERWIVGWGIWYETEGPHDK